MASVRKWPSHVPRVAEAAAAESILNGPDGIPILASEQLLPALSQTAVETRRRSSVCAQEGNDNGRVYEDDCVCDDDEWRTLYLAALQVLSTLLAAGEIVA
tara:strand:+ start:178 stop:480 length:303 start_codon:yes stop_codon:yes gene_type:complete